MKPTTYPLQFVVVTTSSNANSFGLYGTVIVAKNGKAYEIAVGSLYKQPKGKRLTATMSENHEMLGLATDNEVINYEIPRELPTCPKEVVDDIFNMPEPVTA